MDSLRGTREAGKNQLDSLRGIREAGWSHLDSLGGTRETGKDELEPARHQKRRRVDHVIEKVYICNVWGTLGGWDVTCGDAFL